MLKHQDSKNGIKMIDPFTTEEPQFLEKWKKEKYLDMSEWLDCKDDLSFMSEKSLNDDDFKIYPMLFMTEVQASFSNYCVLNVNQFNNETKFNKRLVFIDPCVEDLAKYGFYRYEQFLVWLIEAEMLGSNEFISIDYPLDYMAKHDESKMNWCIEESVRNNFKYADNPQYICCIQSKLKNAKDFKKQFDTLSPIFTEHEKIVGIGAAASHSKYPNEYTDYVFQLLVDNADKLHWLHFYGMGMKLIEKYVPRLLQVGIRVSIDSTKWHMSIMPSGESKTHFLKYMKTIQKNARIPIIW